MTIQHLYFQIYMFLFSVSFTLTNDGLNSGKKQYFMLYLSFVMVDIFMQSPQFAINNRKSIS